MEEQLNEIVGPTGAQGPIGPTGAKGNLGPTGSQGIQGPQGNLGPTGPKALMVQQEYLLHRPGDDVCVRY